MLLGELAIGALDRRSAGAPRHPQDLIGVAHPSRLLQGNQNLAGLDARSAFIWGLRGIFATGICTAGSARRARLALLPRLQGMNFPPALAGLAGRPLQPAFRAAIDIARQKIPAGAPFRGIGLGQRRHRAARAGLGVFPGWLESLSPLVSTSEAALRAKARSLSVGAGALARTAPIEPVTSSSPILAEGVIGAGQAAAARAERRLESMSSRRPPARSPIGQRVPMSYIGRACTGAAARSGPRADATRIS